MATEKRLLTAVRNVEYQVWNRLLSGLGGIKPEHLFPDDGCGAILESYLVDSVVGLGSHCWNSKHVFERISTLFDERLGGGAGGDATTITE
jgi:hypothetical protein